VALESDQYIPFVFEHDVEVFIRVELCGHTAQPFGTISAHLDEARSRHHRGLGGVTEDGQGFHSSLRSQLVGGRASTVCVSSAEPPIPSFDKAFLFIH